MNATRESSNLDFLRAMAVLFVLADHLLVFFGEPSTWFFNPRVLGVLGVLLFFVHTCLVLMFSLERQEAKFGRRSMFTIFMIRRCFRVYPLSMLIVSVIYFAGIPQANVLPWRFTGGDFDFGTYLSNFFLVQNIDNSRSILLPLWSLPFEMQMYLFLPLLYIWVRKLKSRWPLILLWLVAVPVAMVQFKVGFQPRLLWLVPAFLPGVIAYWVSSRATPRFPFWSFAVMLIVLALAYMALPGPAATFKGMPICLLLGLSLPYFVEMKPGLLQVASHLTARYSYGIYVTHMLSQWYSFVYLDHLAPGLQVFVLVATLVGLPVLLYHTLEAPMIRVGNRLVERWFGMSKRVFPEPEVAQDTASVP